MTILNAGEALFGSIGKLGHALFHRPLYYVYRYGPDRLGFWNGASNAYICEQLTRGVEYHHWVTHAGECSELIGRHFEAFVCLIVVMLTGVIVIHWYLMLTRGLMFYCQCSILRYFRRFEEKKKVAFLP